MASVAIRDVRKAFGATTVIHGVDIAILDGEFVVLVGPSGCGKSTLLNMIAGLDTVSDGDIVIGGRRVNDLHVDGTAEQEREAAWCQALEAEAAALPLPGIEGRIIVRWNA